MERWLEVSSSHATRRDQQGDGIRIHTRNQDEDIRLGASPFGSMRLKPKSSCRAQFGTSRVQSSYLDACVAEGSASPKKVSRISRRDEIPMTVSPRTGVWSSPSRGHRSRCAYRDGVCVHRRYVPSSARFDRC